MGSRNTMAAMSAQDLQKRLTRLFSPETVAVIGASENPNKLGFHVMKSLTEGGFRNRIVPVNPGSEKIMGIPALRSMSLFGGPIDLAIIVLPARQVPDIFQECRGKGVKGIVLITAGFKEIEDPAGAELQCSLARLANEADIPVIGPNTFGMINLRANLNASFTPEFSLLKRGHVALVSQSGGISHLLGFMAMRENVGVSKIVGLGNRLNMDFAEMVTFLTGDDDTRVIALYLEGLDDPRRLMEAAKEGKKPILAYKTGSARVGNQASLSHTGSMAGRHEIYRGALKQSGILCVDSAEALLDAAKALSICTPPEGPAVAVLSGQAGPGMAACDLCEAEGLRVVPFSPGTQAKINELLPPLALRINPVDLGPAWYNASAIEGIVNAVIEDERVDGVLLLMMFASANREVVTGLSNLLLDRKGPKPILTCLVSPPGIWDGQVIRLEEAEVLVNLPTPERAARTMALLWQCRTLNARGPEPSSEDRTTQERR